MPRHRVAGVAVSGAALACAALLARDVWRTVHRPDLPSFANQDMSGTFGDPAAPPLRVVALGDSSLTAPGLEDLDDAWLRRVLRDYADRHRVELISLGVGGSRAQEVAAAQLEEAVALQPDIAVVAVGGNDAFRGVTRRRFTRALEAILSGLEAASAAVLLVGVGDLGGIPRLAPSLRPLLTQRSALFDRACTRAAAARPRVVKMEAREPVPPGTDLEAMFAADGFHASAAGHARFAAAAVPAFAAVYRLAREQRERLGPAAPRGATPALPDPQDGWREGPPGCRAITPPRG
ncbi:MAG: hypothetical protein JW785_08375 [Acidimicrobiia bacterium]|nr:hypothetical protein [Acidimicrobiia bacterium]